MGAPEADDHRRSLSGEVARDAPQDADVGHGTRHQPVLDEGTRDGSLGPRLNRIQPEGVSLNRMPSYLCKGLVQGRGVRPRTVTARPLAPCASCITIDGAAARRGNPPR